MGRDDQQTPVLIAGAGPVGMTLALFLAHYNVPSIIVERSAGTTKHPKMDLTNGRSMELFRKIGLVDELRRAGVPPENPFDVLWMMNLVEDDLYRFRYPSAKIKAEQAFNTNDGSFTREQGMRVSQIVIEPVLRAAIERAPLIDLRYETTFCEIIENGDDCVTSKLEHAETGTYCVSSKFLVGCDGGGSRVRRDLKIPLVGEIDAVGAYMVHFRSGARDLFHRNGMSWHYQNSAGTMIAQNDDDIWTLQRWLHPGEDPSGFKPEEVLEGWAGTRFDYEILQANPWKAHFVVAERYQAGRVALAGDAAHQYLPTGGYGMNSGIVDAADLSWMVAAQIQGWGGRDLLQAYEAERKPTAWMHLAASKRHLAVRLAIGEVYADLALEEADGVFNVQARAHAAKRIEALGNAENESWGVEHGYRYADSPLIAHEGGAPDLQPIEYRPDTWPGSRLPHVFIDEEVSIYDMLGPYFTLVSFVDSDVDAFAGAAARLGVPLETVTVDRSDLRSIFKRSHLLVRPDHHIVWRGDTMPADPAAILELATGRTKRSAGYGVTVATSA